MFDNTYAVGRPPPINPGLADLSVLGNVTYNPPPPTLGMTLNSVARAHRTRRMLDTCMTSEEWARFDAGLPVAIIRDDHC